ncbi:hypothetical protein ABKV19_026493 [Rosa sericea]
MLSFRNKPTHGEGLEWVQGVVAASQGSNQKVELKDIKIVVALIAIAPNFSPCLFLMSKRVQMEKHIKTLIVLSHYLEVQSFSSPLSTILSKLKTPQLPKGSYFGKDKSLEFMQLCIYLRDLSFNKLEQELKILNLQLI